MRFFRLMGKTFGIALSKELAYKENFFIKSFAMLFWDLVGPLVILLVYQHSSGIEGWSFEEFLLFQGTLTLVFGISTMLFYDIAYVVIGMVRRGRFDAVLTTPANPLLYLAASNVIVDDAIKVVVGLVLIGYSVVKMNLALLSWNTIAYLFMILLGIIAQFAFIVLICSMAMLFVHSYALMDLLFKLSDFIRYPLNVYSSGLVVTLTFLLPLAVSSFYPAEALLHGISGVNVVIITLPVLCFLGFSLWMWNLGLRKYTSSGG